MAPFDRNHETQRAGGGLPSEAYRSLYNGGRSGEPVLDPGESFFCARLPTRVKDSITVRVTVATTLYPAAGR